MVPDPRLGLPVQFLSIRFIDVRVLTIQKLDTVKVCMPHRISHPKSPSTPQITGIWACAQEAFNFNYVHQVIPVMIRPPPVSVKFLID